MVKADMHVALGHPAMAEVGGERVEVQSIHIPVAVEIAIGCCLAKVLTDDSKIGAIDDVVTVSVAIRGERTGGEKATMFQYFDHAIGLSRGFAQAESILNWCTVSMIFLAAIGSAT